MEVASAKKKIKIFNLEYIFPLIFGRKTKLKIHRNHEDNLQIQHTFC